MNHLENSSQKSNIQKVIYRIPGLLEILSNAPVTIQICPIDDPRKHDVFIIRDGELLTQMLVGGYENRTEDLKSKIIDDLTEIGIAVV